MAKSADFDVVVEFEPDERCMEGALRYLLGIDEDSDGVDVVPGDIPGT